MKIQAEERMRYLNSLAKAKAECEAANKYYWDRAKAEHDAWSDEIAELGWEMIEEALAIKELLETLDALKVMGFNDKDNIPENYPTNELSKDKEENKNPSRVLQEKLTKVINDHFSTDFEASILKNLTIGSLVGEGFIDKFVQGFSDMLEHGGTEGYDLVNSLLDGFENGKKLTLFDTSLIPDDSSTGFNGILPFTNEKKLTNNVHLYLDLHTSVDDKMTSTLHTQYITLTPLRKMVHELTHVADYFGFENYEEYTEYRKDYKKFGKTSIMNVGGRNYKLDVPNPGELSALMTTNIILNNIQNSKGIRDQDVRTVYGRFKNEDYSPIHFETDLYGNKL